MVFVDLQNQGRDEANRLGRACGNLISARSIPFAIAAQQTKPEP